MEKIELKNLVDVAAGRRGADLVIANGMVADVYGGSFYRADVAVCGGRIAGVGDYAGSGAPSPAALFDARGLFVVPGFIESHIHIESSMVGPAEFGRLVAARGTTTVVADPHEIVNVAGLSAFYAMMSAAEGSPLDIKFMVPSCVPATATERGGAVLDAGALSGPARDSRVLGLGELMDYQAVIAGENGVLDKILLALDAGKLIDGHSPGVRGNDLNAYAAFVHTDHECSTVEELRERVRRGMYVMLREGSACRDLRKLLKGVTAENSRRCILCSDDRQSETLIGRGSLDDHLRICVEEGLDPMSALRMATVNAAECFRLFDRGAVAPGLRADLALVDDLEGFRARRVYVAGSLVAEEGRCLFQPPRWEAQALRRSFHVKGFSAERLALPLKSEKVHVIDVKPGTVVTGKGIAWVRRENGLFVFDPSVDAAKIAVVERHRETGLVGLGLIRGYGIKRGAVAVSIAHDSHNIITAGTGDNDMVLAVNRLIEIEGGAVLARDGAVIAELPLPLGGLMSDMSGEWVEDRLKKLHQTAWDELGVNRELEPVLTFAFMSLVVIPELKLTCDGLFDTGAFGFISVDAP